MNSTEHFPPAARGPGVIAAAGCALFVIASGCEHDLVLLGFAAPGDLSGANPDGSPTRDPTPDLGRPMLPPCGDQRGLQMNAPWPMPGYCPTHIGRSPNPGPRSTKLRWKGGHVATSFLESPAVSIAGMIFSGAGPLIALEAATGQTKWSYDAQRTGFSSSQAIGADGTVYFGSPRGSLIAFDGASGVQKWSLDLKTGYSASSPMVGGDGTIYLSSGGVHAVAPSGQLKWSNKEVLGVGTAAIGLDDTVYVISFQGGSDTQLSALDGTNGQRKWWFPMSAGSSSVPSIGTDGTLYVAGKLYVYALDARSALLRWAYRIGEGQFTSTALTADGRVVLGAGKSLLGLGAESGTVVSRVELPDYMTSSPTIDGEGTIYVGCHDHNLYAIDGATWKVRWSYATGGSISTSASIGPERTLYFGSQDNFIYALGE